MIGHHRGVTPGRVLIATDNHADAEVILHMLGAEFAVVHISTDPDKMREDFEHHAPQVLVLAFDDIDHALRYRLALQPDDGVVGQSLSPRRDILLCGKDDVKRAYELCQQRSFDDYCLFWPMTNDASRLPMSVHLALRELAALSARDAQEAQADAEAAATAHLLPVVLVVDDDDVQRNLVALVLKDEPYRLVMAASAREALTALRSARPAVILMDIQMPDMDGIAAMRQIKADPRFAAVPVIMLTGHSGGGNVRDSLQCGAADFIIKPFRREQLIAKVAAAASAREESAWH
jgi:CheY-like chemotaxis protein